MPSNLFSDLLVIDCASYVAGPAAATVMSDFGARVIKIEPPGEGDAYRTLIKYRGVEGVIDYFWTLDSRNKESLALDLRDPKGRAVLETLIKRADVFITNYPFPVRAKLRLNAEDIRPLNPRLIYASLTPFGEQGPERDRRGFDVSAWWARSGLMDMVRATGETEVAYSMPAMGDHPTSMSMYAAILTGLYKRAVTGEGCEVTTSLLANGLWSNGCQVQAALCDLELLPRGEFGARNPLQDAYKTADGRLIALTVVNGEREWPALCNAMGHPEWLEEELLATPMDRFLNAMILATWLTDEFIQKDAADWQDILDAAGVTHSLVGRITDHAHDPQINANGMLPEFADGDGLRTLDSPFNVSGEEKHQPRMAPSVGQHSRAILAECGLSAAEIDSLIGG